MPTHVVSKFGIKTSARRSSAKTALRRPTFHPSFRRRGCAPNSRRRSHCSRITTKKLWVGSQRCVWCISLLCARVRQTHFVAFAPFSPAVTRRGAHVATLVCARSETLCLITSLTLRRSVDRRRCRSRTTSSMRLVTPCLTGAQTACWRANATMWNTVCRPLSTS